MQKKILIINGPNLNLLGAREPEIYGTTTLAEIKNACEKKAKILGIKLEFVQSNAEVEIINYIQNAKADKITHIIINPAAYSHTSIAILDALLAVNIPIIEVHLSNLYKREAFRQISYTAKAAIGIISGFDFTGYLLAIDYCNTTN